MQLTAYSHLTSNLEIYFPPVFITYIDADH